jgi:DNA-3-methyladenine glycosylase II
MCNSTPIQPTLISLPHPETFLCAKDQTLCNIIVAMRERWSDRPDPAPILGLLSTVISQQISTKAALTLRKRVIDTYPSLTRGLFAGVSVEGLLTCGLPKRKAECCAYLVVNAHSILRQVATGKSWDEVLLPISGIGKWTVTIFRILVLREPDVLPSGDLGLDRAFSNHYPAGAKIGLVSECWRPYRSVACWYLWRSLGNPSLG